MVSQVHSLLAAARAARTPIGNPAQRPFFLENRQPSPKTRSICRCGTPKGSDVGGSCHGGEEQVEHPTRFRCPSTISPVQNSSYCVSDSGSSSATTIVTWDAVFRLFPSACN